MLGKIEGRRKRGGLENEMIGWHHRLNGHEFEQTQGDSEGHAAVHGITKNPTGLSNSTTTTTTTTLQ